MTKQRRLPKTIKEAYDALLEVGFIDATVTGIHGHGNRKRARHIKLHHPERLITLTLPHLGSKQQDLTGYMKNRVRKLLSGDGTAADRSKAH